jgi:hypothetical protein
MSTRCRTAFALPAATAALALAVAGCSSLKVKTDYDPNVDFARYNTYAWLKPPVKYQKASDGSGHFRVAYHVILKDKTRVRTNPGVYYGGYYDRGHYGASYGGASSYDYQEGTLLIDVIDARSDSIAWRGWAIGTNKEGYYSEKQVAKAAHKILEKFPPQGVTPTSSDEEALRRRVDELEQRLKELDEQEQKGSGA